MPSKYDTNPLDPDFPQKAKAAAEAEIATHGLNASDPHTRKFADANEEQTRRFAPADTSAYAAPQYTGQYVPAAAGFASADRSISRKVDKVGLPENLLTALPYVPLYIGVAASVLELLFVPRSESKVRFHAAQGLAIHIGILLVTSALSIIGNVASGARAGNAVFQIVMFVMLIIWTIKAWKGKPVHIESVDALTNWLDEKIKWKS